MAGKGGAVQSKRGPKTVRDHTTGKDWESASAQLRSGPRITHRMYTRVFTRLERSESDFMNNTRPLCSLLRAPEQGIRESAACRAADPVADGGQRGLRRGAARMAATTLYDTVHPGGSGLAVTLRSVGSDTAADSSREGGRHPY